MTGVRNLKIDHIAIWARDLEGLRAYYEKYFNAKSGSKYVNAAKGFSSYFLSFDSGCRLEIMQADSVLNPEVEEGLNYFGLTHFSISLGSKEDVDRLADSLIKDGFKLLDGPRHTGDGYYEAKFLDPEGNQLEITI